MFHCVSLNIVLPCVKTRAPDNFLKQGVADALFEAKGIVLQNPEVYSLQSFHTRAFLEVANLILGKRKNAAHNRSHNLPTLYNILVTSS